MNEGNKWIKAVLLAGAILSIYKNYLENDKNKESHR